jgi:hypothetical protein
MAKRRFYSRLASDEITMRGYRILTSTKCMTIRIAELAVTSGLGSSLYYMVWVWSGWNGFSVACVEPCDP